MVSDEICMLPAVDLVARYRAGTLSPVEATRAVLDRIREYDGALNAFIIVAEDEAMAAARASEARWKRGEPIGLIDGVPTTIKDVILMKGHPTRRGSKTTPVTAETEDAPITARLREHGAVFVGKTTAPEFGWKAVGDSPLTGISRNPWNPGKTPGGSSAGAAAGLAAGMGALAVGSDGGGSIRIPASLTGVFGLKPTVGRVPYYPPAGVGSCAIVGPMTRTVKDAALMMNVIAAYDPRDPLALRIRAPDYTVALEEGVKGLRIALCPSLGYAEIDPDVEKAIRAAAQVFADLGATVEEVERVFDSPREPYEDFYRVSMASSYRTLSDAQKKMLDPGFVEMAEQGLAVDLFTYQGIERTRSILGATVNAFLERYDLLLSAQLGVASVDAGHEVPPGRGMRRWLDWAPTAYPFNFTGHPAASAPCGFGDDAMPVGLQIVGRRFDDGLVLRASRAYESAHPFPMPALAGLKQTASSGHRP
jgi:aspartyl-tRNA(Asn)/glutamyl-tRNA(Gln) amidotransferase subunit A